MILYGMIKSIIKSIKSKKQKNITLEDVDTIEIKEEPDTTMDDELLDAELIRRLVELTPSELEKVESFVQGLLAAREGAASPRG